MAARRKFDLDHKLFALPRWNPHAGYTSDNAHAYCIKKDGSSILMYFITFLKINNSLNFTYMYIYKYFLAINEHVLIINNWIFILILQDPDLCVSMDLKLLEIVITQCVMLWLASRQYPIGWKCYRYPKCCLVHLYRNDPLCRIQVDQSIFQGSKFLLSNWRSFLWQFIQE